MTRTDRILAACFAAAITGMLPAAVLAHALGA